MAENLSLQNFDWDAFENEAQGKQNEELVGKYDQTLSAIKDQEVVEGTVMSINNITDCTDDFAPKIIEYYRKLGKIF